MKRIKTIIRDLEAKGYTVIEREDTLVLAQELQKETLQFLNEDGTLDFNYAPFICPNDTDTAVNEEIETIIGDGWFFECEYPYCFKMYKA